MVQPLQFRRPHSRSPCGLSGPSEVDVAVIGGGIVGLATALSLLRRAERSLVLLEAEPTVAAHPGIVDFARVARAMATAVGELGGMVRTGARVLEIVVRSDEFVLQTADAEIRCRNLVNCAGLQSDRVARMCGIDPGVRIVPFRGTYLRVRPERRHLVRGLVYPVPDPALPFLGAHFTRTIDGTVEAGPTAVLAFARERYGRGDVAWRDVAHMARYVGFWRMVRHHWRTGLAELHQAFRPRALLRQMRALIPTIAPADLEPGRAGIRAQAVAPNGQLVDGPALIERPGMLHVVNAPSPAATAALAIGDLLADRAHRVFRAPRRPAIAAAPRTHATPPAGMWDR